MNLPCFCSKASTSLFHRFIRHRSSNLVKTRPICLFTSRQHSILNSELFCAISGAIKIPSLVQESNFSTSIAKRARFVQYVPEEAAIEAELLKKFTPDELKASPEMLRRIVEEHKKNGKNFKIPWDDSEAVKKMLKNIERLIRQGVRPAFILDGCIKSPELFKALIQKNNHTWEIIDCLVGTCRFTFEDAMRLFSVYSEIFLEVGTEQMLQRLNIFFECGIPSGYEIAELIDNHPEILYDGDTKRMHETAQNLVHFFTQNERQKLLVKTPHVLLKNFEELEEKYEYIFFHMAMEAGELLVSKKWFERDLEEIMMRHQFLEKTGRYKMPDPKRPQLKKDNPLLDQILDTDEENFATSVAGVTLEEWNIYELLDDKLKSFEGKEKPFERIKPSARKAYQRRKKEMQEKEDFVFDGSSDIEKVK